MCGFTGFFEQRANYNLADIAKGMADRIRHRGPDDFGVWCDTDTGFAVAHRRLSILDLSPAGHQPMLSASGRWVLAFNGEIYNHFQLRQQLAADGQTPAWRGHSDTETLLACIEAWGLEATLKHSTGMFALALWDCSAKTLFLARDRMGEKPLYYGWQGNTFLFGSELKALRAHPAFNADIDRGALVLLLRHNYIPAPYSIWQGIQKLPAGTWLNINPAAKDTEPVPYWSLAAVAEQGMANPFQGSEAEAITALEKHLGNAVRGQMMADVPLGALLSGGIDSSLVTALMQANSAKPIRTFTIGFAEQEFNEAIHAREVAKHLGTDHTELYVSANDALALVPQLPDMYDEPFADSSQLPTHLVMKLAKQHVTVALSGDAGDELFGGYKRYFLAPQAWQKIGWLPPVLRHMLGKGLTALPVEVINRLTGPISRHAGIAKAGDKAHKLGLRLASVNSLDDLYVSLVTEWPHAERLVIGGSIPVNLLDSRTHWPKLHHDVARMMALDSLTYLPDDILVKVDRAAMAASLETRAPFLDLDVIGFAWSLPMPMKLGNGKGKLPLRQLLDRYVPRELIDRPKMGFGIPLDDWLRGPLRDWAEALLAEDRLKQEGYLNPAPIRAAWLQHLRCEASFGYRLWSVLMFQAWLENLRNDH